MNVKKKIFNGTTAYLFLGYGETLASFIELLAIAQADFPALNITPDKVTVGKVTKSHYMQGFSLITFQVPAGTRHPEYGESNTFDFNWA